MSQSERQLAGLTVPVETIVNMVSVNVKSIINMVHGPAMTVNGAC